MPIKSFLEYLELEKNCSKHTITSYKTDLTSISNFAKDNLDTDNIQRLNYGEIRTWIVSLVESGISNRSINRKVSALSSYYKFLLKTNSISVNPLVKHKALKTKKKVIVPFSSNEIESVLDFLEIEKKDFESVRNKFIVELFYSTGIRRSELLEIKLNDLCFESKTLKVLGKRNKERLIPLISTVFKTYNDYIELRQSLPNIVDESYLFLTIKGRKIYDTLVYRIINEYFSRASSKQKCSPHVLRHSFATHLLNEGANLNSVKELLGHTSLAATQVYTHNSIAELKKVYTNTHPRSKN